MIDKIKELKEYLVPQISDKLLLWDFRKMKIREFIMSFSKEKAKWRRNEVEKLEKEIEKLEDQLLLAPSRNVIDEIEYKKAALSNLYDYFKQGIRVRSRADWVEKGENNIQYFEQLLKSNKKKTVIRELYDKESKTISNKNEILKIIRAFYEKLYSTEEKNTLIIHPRFLVTSHD